MFNDGLTTWFHSNRYSAQAACEHCEGLVHHARSGGLLRL
jgi:hypothetical protein